MTKGLKALVGVVLVFSLLISGVGYASLTDTLSVTGTASAEMPKEVVVTAAQAVTGCDGVDFSANVMRVKNVTFDTYGKATLTFSVLNNTAEEQMFYGVNGYSAVVSDPNKVETGNALDSDGTAYVVGIDGVKENVVSAVTGAKISAGTSHNNLQLTLTGTAGQNVGDVTISLVYRPADDHKLWQGYLISFIDGTIAGEDKSIAVTGTLPAGGEWVDETTKKQILVTTTTAEGVAQTTDADMTLIKPDDSRLFNYWNNALGVRIDSIKANNTNNYILYADWTSVYTIFIFADDGSLLHSETFTSNTTSLSDEAIAKMQQHLDEINTAEKKAQSLEATWPEITETDFDQQKDIQIKPVWSFTGNAVLHPEDKDGDGVIDEYYIIGTDEGGDVNITIPEEVNGIPVTQISDGAFSEFNNLRNIYLTTNITHIGYDAFADEEAASGLGGLLGQKKYETIQIFYEGTMDDWETKVTKDEGWDRYVGQNSVIKCSDGVLKLTSINSQNVTKVWTPYTKDQFVSPATAWETFDTWEEFCTIIWDQDETGHFVWP